MNYKLNESKMFSDITEGIAIVINSLTGVYYGMNSFGTIVFDNLISGSSVEEIVSTVKAIPGAPADIEKRVALFVSTLENFEIIITAEDSIPRMPVIDSSVATSDAFIPECKEYKDVQELLFADPIHDVKVDEGWQPGK